MFSKWLSQTVRVYAGQPFVEMEWVVGPVPIADSLVGCRVAVCGACGLAWRGSPVGVVYVKCCGWRRNCTIRKTSLTFPNK